MELAAKQDRFDHWHKPDLDGIRGVLAIGVVLLHFGINSFLFRYMRWNGFEFQLCVDVFFLLSGFVLASSYKNSSRHDSRLFVIKRFFRLAPVFYLTTAVALIASPPPPTWQLVVAELFMARPVIGQEPTNFPAWSISWEFYLPIFAYLVAPWLVRLHPFRRPLLVVAIVALSIVDIRVAQGERFYFSRAFLGLVTGSCLFSVYRDRSFSRPALTYALFILLIVVFATATGYPLAAALVPIVAAILIWSAAGVPTSVFSSRPLQWLGAISYTVYMVHAPVLIAMKTIWGSNVAANAPAKVAGIVLSLVLAVLLTRYVEGPGMRWGKRLISTLRGRPPLPVC